MRRPLLLLVMLVLMGVTTSKAMVVKSSFTYSCQPAPSLLCTFKSTSTGTPVKYTWNWGDGHGETHTIDTTSHRYAVPGTYTVRLTVYDQAAASSYSTKKIPVPNVCTCVRVDTVTIIKTDTVVVVKPDTTPPVTPPITPPSSGTWTQPVAGETFASLPQSYVDTKALPAPATGGKILFVPVGGNLQAALNAALPGDVVELANGGTWTGNFALPNKTGAGWITIRPSDTTMLPPPGTRIHPLTNLPKLVSPNNQEAVATMFGAHHWRLVGLDVTTFVQNTGLVRMGTGYEKTVAELPHDLILDRMYIHGSPTSFLRRAVVLNGGSSAVIDSYISEVHDNGPDSQTISGWSGPGPYKIVNNYLEAASEIVMFGGSDPLIKNMVPCDIEMRRNHFYKDPAWNGKGFNIKNLLELKSGCRVLVEQNVMENNWQDGQGGSAILMKSVNQGGTCPGCVVSDVTFRGNVIRNTGSGFNLLGHDVGAASIMSRVTITDNLIVTVDSGNFRGDGRGFLISNNPVDLVIAHNTIMSPTNTAITFGGPSTELPVRLMIRDNIIHGGDYGVKGEGMGTAQAISTFVTPLGGKFLNNVIVTGDPSGYPPTTGLPNSTAKIGFTSTTNLTLLPTSSYKGKGTNGKDPGLDFAGILAGVTGVIQP